MTPRRFKRRKVESALRKHSYTLFSEGGKHSIYKNEAGIRVTLPRHSEISIGVIKIIERDTGIPRVEFQ